MLNNSLSAILGERRLKISKLSRETGILRSTLTNLYYQKTISISFVVLEKLCKYLNCSVNDLIEYITDFNKSERSINFVR